MNALMPGIENRDSRSTGWLTVVGRLKSGITRAQATAELDVLARNLAQSYPGFEKNRGFHLESAGSLPPKYKTAVTLFLAMLMGVVLLVLCIACANVANLLLAQAAGRQREMAVRLALGATRRQLMSHMLTESALLACAGGLLGVTVSLWATRALSAFRLPLPVPVELTVAIDWRVLVYTVLLSLATAMLFGLAPAWMAARPVLTNALKGEDALAGPGRPWSLRNILVVSQIAMSLILLCATGLFLRSLKNASRIDTGFHSRGVLMMAIDPRLNGYTSERTVRLLGQLRERVSALPGVLSAAWTDTAPLSIGGTRDGFHVAGLPDSTGTGPLVDLYLATPGYFETLGIPRIAGRDFVDESPTAPKVAVVNEDFARRLFGKGSAIGRQVTGGRETYRIIGVVRNTKSRTLGEDVRPVLYRSLAQTIAGDPSFLGYSLLVRFAGGAAPISRAVRREIHLLDPSLAVFNAETMSEHLRDALFLPRLAGILFGVFGITGLLLAAVGLYGVMSYSVSRRTREIGIRMALGAQPGGVRRLIVRQGMLLTFFALVVGLAAAWALARFSAAVLYGIQPHDIVTFTAVPLFLAAIAFLACWIPSRRASKVDPLTALRHE
jgi:predicted permease